MKRLVLGLLIVLGAVGCASVGDVVPKAQFRDEVADLIKDMQPGSCVAAVDDDTLRYGPSGAACDNRVLTGVLYEQYLAFPDRRAELQEQLARSAISIVSARGAGDFQDRLVVVLRAPDFSQYQEEWQLVHQRFAGDLAAVMMVDDPEDMRGVRLPELQAIGLSEAEAFELARRHLRERSAERVAEDDAGFELVTSMSGIATGFLWLPESCTAEAEGSEALVTTANTFLRVAAGDDEALGRFRALTSDLIGKEISMSSTVLICRSGEWAAGDAP